MLGLRPPVTSVHPHPGSEHEILVKQPRRSSRRCLHGGDRGRESSGTGIYFMTEAPRAQVNRLASTTKTWDLKHCHSIFAPGTLRQILINPPKDLSLSTAM